MLLVKIITYVDNVHDITTSLNPGQSVQVLKQLFKHRLGKAQKLDILFNSEKSEVIHFSICVRQKKSKINMHLDNNSQSIIVERKPQICLI
jgi:hypothetical protein